MDPIPTPELCLNMGFWILSGPLSILIVKFPSGHLIFASHKKLEALRAKISPISEVNIFFWLYAMDVYSRTKMLAVFRLDSG